MRNFMYLVGCLVACAATTGQAQTPGYWGWYGPPYTNYQRAHIPYFALHPPVYYSHIVPRSFGYSPFAYPPGTMTPEVSVEPQTIINPHVKPEAPAPGVEKSSVRKRATEDQAATIINPYASEGLAQQ